MLTAQEIEQYHEQGFVIPAEFRLSERELAPLLLALDAVLRDNPEILPDRFINPHLDGGEPYGIRGQKAFFDIAHDERILDMAQAVMGPDLMLLFSHLFCKPAASSREVPWHQDGPFWPVRPMASCTVWLALDKVDRDNGAMRIIPGSHRREVHEHSFVERENSTLNHEIDATRVDESNARFIELEAGEVSVHDIGLVHGSAANASARRRAGFALRYTPTTSWVYRVMPNAAADWSRMPVELVRGSSRHESNDFSVGGFGKPWA